MIDRLPRRLGEMVAAFRRGAAALVQSSAAGLLEGPAVPPMVLIRAATIQTRFSVTREEDEDILFVFHQGTGKRPMLDASIRFRIVPAIFLAPRVPPMVPLPDLPAAAKTPLIEEIVQRMCQAWREAYTAAAETSFAEDSPLRPLLPDFEVRDYEGVLLLRLAPDNPAALRIKLQVRLEGGSPAARIFLEPVVLDC
jgi:hypothetical protein